MQEEKKERKFEDGKKSAELWKDGHFYHPFSEFQV